MKNFKDPEVIPVLIELLKHRENYIYAEAIIDMVNDMGESDTYLQTIRKLAFEASMEEATND